VVPARAVADPTGVGDAFRAGFLAGLAWGLGYERCAQVGALLATHVLEIVGTQEYRLERDPALRRFADAYGDEAAAELETHLAGVVPA
jgi:adenosine kinase